MRYPDPLVRPADCDLIGQGYDHNTSYRIGGLKLGKTSWCAGKDTRPPDCRDMIRLASFGVINDQ